jgi:hypothetical protein
MMLHALVTASALMLATTTAAPEPSYCWLTFGPEAKVRVFVRYDGEAISFERHDKGKATGPVERFAQLKDFKPVTIADPDGKTSYVIQAVFNIDYVEDLGRGLAVDVEVRGPIGYWQGAHIRLNEQTDKATTVAFHSSLTIGHYEYAKATPDLKLEWKAHNIPPLVIGDKPAKLNTQVHNRHPNPDCHVVVESTDDTGVKSRFPKDVRPVAEVEFPPAKPGGAVVRRRYVLDQVCCGSNFYAPIPVPKEAGVGMAKVTFSFPDWQGVSVAPCTVEIPVVEPQSVPK